ncbi:hypothetical protein SEA_SAPO_52 [Gordonia phage Sapo]|nr:hypothetical protein SEA_SAPO_52 [Gordonia phage Sapo]
MKPQDASDRQKKWNRVCAEFEPHREAREKLTNLVSLLKTWGNVAAPGLSENYRGGANEDLRNTVVRAVYAAVSAWPKRFVVTPSTADFLTDELATFHGQLSDATDRLVVGKLADLLARASGK